MLPHLSAALLIVSLSPALALAHAGAALQLARAEARLPDVEAYLEKSATLRRAGQLEAAEQAVMAASKLEPGSFRVLLEMGSVFMVQERLEDAEMVLSAAIAKEKNATAYLLRGLARRGMKRPGHGAYDFEHAYRLRPDADTALYLARAQQDSGRDEDAVKTLQQAMAQLGGPVAIREELVVLQLDLGQYGDALKLIDALLPSLQVKADWRLKRADALEGLERAREAKAERLAALAELDRLLAKSPNALRRVLRADALEALGRREEARLERERVDQGMPAPAVGP